jgi:hypothetical protein
MQDDTPFDLAKKMLRTSGELAETAARLMEESRELKAKAQELLGRASAVENEAEGRSESDA